MVGTGHVGSTIPRGTVVLRLVMTPGIGANVLVVVDVLEVVVVGGRVVAVGSSGVVTDGAVVGVGGAVIGAKQSVPGRYKRIGVRTLGAGVAKKVAG